MSDKTYQIELIIYGMPDWWLTSSWSSQPWLSEEPYKAVETTFHGTLTELEVFCDDLVDEHSIKSCTCKFCLLFELWVIDSDGEDVDDLCVLQC